MCSGEHEHAVHERVIYFNYEVIILLNGDAQRTTRFSRPAMLRHPP